MQPIIALVLMSSGLFLGWNLGANDAASILGTAVGSKMLSFKRAATIGAIFVVLGAVFAGSGGVNTLGRLGQVPSLEAAFVVALSAAVCIWLFIRSSLPVSTSQAMVGAIVGWSIFSGDRVNWGVLSSIAGSWVASPVISGLIAFFLYHLFKWILAHWKMHMFHQDIILRFCLGAAGAIGAFSLGANNVANVMGVFAGSSRMPSFDLGLFSIGSSQILFLLGGISIAAGMVTYSRNIMMTMGSEIFHLSPENALVAVLSVSAVLMLFSTSFLPSVPVSSTQAAVGAVLGIAVAKGGARSVNGKLLLKIAAGWILNPLLAAIASVVLLSIWRNVFLLPL